MGDLGEWSMEDLRALRSSSRRALELARMRTSPDDPGAAAELESLRRVVEETTDELIRRYSEDLSLVDSLLGAPYARRTSPHEAGES